MNYLRTCCVCFFFFCLGCNKRCTEIGHFVVPASVVTSLPAQYAINKDTIDITIRIPYLTQDLRDLASINIKSYRQSPVYISLVPILHELNGERPILLLEKYFDVITIRGKRESSTELLYSYAPFLDAWEISIKLIPRRPVKGLVALSVSGTRYSDKCLVITPEYQWNVVSKNWHLLSEINWPYSPWQNEILFKILE